MLTLICIWTAAAFLAWLFVYGAGRATKSDPCGVQNMTQQLNRKARYRQKHIENRLTHSRRLIAITARQPMRIAANVNAPPSSVGPDALIVRPSCGEGRSPPFERRGSGTRFKHVRSAR